jgi:hypothetical protein
MPVLRLHHHRLPMHLLLRAQAVTPLVTVLAPQPADDHEHRHNPACLLLTDGITRCPTPAAYRAELTPLPGYQWGPVTFACTEHALSLLGRPDLVSIRSVQP